MGLEHRRFTRITEACTVKFTTSSGQTGEGQLADISLGGTRFVTKENLQMGQLMEITFQLGSAPPFRFTAWVKYKKEESGQTQYGLEFTLGDQRDLHEYIRLNDYIWKTPKP